MSCNNCGDSSTSNPCGHYDDCGCINPTTLDCISTKKPLANLQIEKGDTGEEILDSINTIVGDLADKKGDIKVDEADTCPAPLVDKLEAGLNITLSVVGTGCDKKVRIDAVDGGVPVDVNVRVSETDTTAGSLSTKIENGAFLTKTVVNPGGAEKLRLDVSIDNVISADAGNQLIKGTDGKLKTLYTAPDGSETKIIAGNGANVSGLGTIQNPYVVSTEGSIYTKRNCFDGEWKSLTVPTNSGVTGVTYISSDLKYRVRFDGTIEFKGSVTYTVQFGNYQTGPRKLSVNVASLAIDCLTLTEQAGTSDLKSMNYIDIPQAGADQYPQLFGYVIKKSGQNVIVDFQSSFINPTSKTIMVTFDGAVSHPNI